jgi:WD40 repeat protein
LILVSNATSAFGQTTGEVWTLTDHKSGVHALAFSPDGKTLAAGSAGGKTSDMSGKLILYETNHYRPVSSLMSERNTWFLTYSPEGKILATGALDGTVTLWDVTGARARASFRNPVGVNTLRYSSDGSVLVVGGVSGGGVHAYDARTLSPKWRYVFRVDEIVSLAAGNKGTALAAACGSAVVLLDVAAGKVTALFDYGGDVSSLAISPDGSLLAASSLDETTPLRLWDTASKKVLWKLDANSAALGFSPDGRKLMICGIGTHVEVWDALKRQKLRILKGHAPRIRSGPGILRSLTIAPDGKTIAAGGADETVMVWDLSK